MGSGAWQSDTYTARETAQKAAGQSAFHYTDTLRSVPRSQWAVHEQLDPKALNKNGPFAGTFTRECADSSEHPNSLPIAIMFDVTGSMASIPKTLQRQLPNLHALLQDKGYVEDPQILFGAVGDGYSDALPIQFGQFESDNRMDEQLGNIVLEGGGGGANHESYELAAYYLANHTHLDSAKKRGHKGYAFFIGDERIYTHVNRNQVQKLLGETIAQDIPVAEVFEKLKEQYEVYFVFAEQGSYPYEAIVDGVSPYGYDNAGTHWRPLVGENIIRMDDAENICELIAEKIAIGEGTILSSNQLDATALTDDATAAAAALLI